MIVLVHTGHGGALSRHIQNIVERAGYGRACELARSYAGQVGYVVVISAGAPAMHEQKLDEILETHDDVVFVVGDSSGLPQRALECADAQFSVSSLRVSHGCQATIVAEAIAAAIARSPRREEQSCQT